MKDPSAFKFYSLRSWINVCGITQRDDVALDLERALAYPGISKIQKNNLIYKIL